MDRHLDITFDLETASLSSHAAILQIAAVAWDRFAEDADHMFVTKPECAYAREAADTEHFCVSTDLNSQFVEGLWDFSQSTSEWWRGQSDAAKHAVVGHADNTGAVYNDNHTIQYDKGHGPIEAEVIAADFELDTTVNAFRVDAINSFGMQVGQTPAEVADGKLRFSTGGDFPSVYYLIQKI